MRHDGVGGPGLRGRIHRIVLIVVTLMAMVVALANVGCAGSSIAAEYPQARFMHVCASAPRVESEGAPPYHSQPFSMVLDSRRGLVKIRRCIARLRSAS